jgi:LPS-assembly lipoprotein
VLLATTSVLSACGPGGFQPLYGPSVSGIGVQQKLAQVDFAPIPGRVGQRIRNELVFQRDAGEELAPSVYRLEVRSPIRCSPRWSGPDGDALGQSIPAGQFQAHQHQDQASGMLTGSEQWPAGFERFQSIYSNARARDDALPRSARRVTVADDLKTCG